jgi:hypothetical protein
MVINSMPLHCNQTAIAYTGQAILRGMTNPAFERQLTHSRFDNLASLNSHHPDNSAFSREVEALDAGRKREQGECFHSPCYRLAK